MLGWMTVARMVPLKPPPELICALILLSDEENGVPVKIIILAAEIPAAGHEVQILVAELRLLPDQIGNHGAAPVDAEVPVAKRQVVRIVDCREPKRVRPRVPDLRPVAHG